MKIKLGKKKSKAWIIFSLSILAIVIFFVVGFFQTSLKITYYNYKSTKVPKAFNGYKILVISDLHNKNFGTNQSDLLENINKLSPDIIALTGDIIDEDHDDLSSIDVLLENLVSIAPVFFVSGNHEECKEAKLQYSALLDLLDRYGVTNLNDNSTEITVDDSTIMLTGYRFYGSQINKKITPADQNYFNILLYHSNTAFDSICNMGYDIILSGHGHGGIIRIPYVGGVLGNSGNFFPKYDSGAFTKGDSTMFVSRGLGDSYIPRCYNNPELVLITLNTY